MSDKDAERARRLGEALRENLKRRKAQGRDKGADASKPLPPGAEPEIKPEP